ncbi:hypothetical protein GCM10025868_46720 [Angustibacter aerolatus]|uniref:Lsr2 DNA-binding domain-containing protein n=1 Tax=Angustibacter aerolatus TaxID=1162965 RepID=A0ABQ6JNV3_9ACTN|nr:hypothetical protein GCM10025868_46720 [Angustibacter aerolatus]
MGHARRVTPAAAAASAAGAPTTRAARAGSASAAAGTDTAAIRQWAKENGHEVSERGRISAAVMDAYAAAH